MSPPPMGSGDDPETGDLSTSATRSHRAPTPRKKRRLLLPGPAVFGIAAMVVAGVGVVKSSDDVGSTFTAEPSTLATPLTVPDDSFRRPNSADISRSISRETLEKQAETQALQRDQALAELESQTQDRADELLKAQKRREREQAEREEAAEDGGLSASAEGSDASDATTSGQWVLPVAGYSLSSTFGETGPYWETIHTGLDFAAASGTPLVAVTSGTITSAGYESAYGNKTVLTLDDGTEIWYCHQTSFEVSTGETVEPGETIGTVGATGNVTGPHLHLEVRPGGGDPVDPYATLQEHGVTP
ncbi:MAG: M23 family metallopeptidase [Nocardioidaceae bacterium]